MICEVDTYAGPQSQVGGKRAPSIRAPHRARAAHRGMEDPFSSTKCLWPGKIKWFYIPYGKQLYATEGKEFFQLIHLKDFIQAERVLHRERLQDFYVQSKSFQATPAVNASGKTGRQEGWGVRDYCEGIRPEQDTASFKFKPYQEPAHHTSVSMSF